MSRRRKKNQHVGETLRFTAKGVQMMARILFDEGWLPLAQLETVHAAFERGWDWSKPECQKAFADMKLAAEQSTDAWRAVSLALSKKLGHLLTLEEAETIERPRGPYYTENQGMLREYEKEHEGQPLKTVPVASEELFCEALELYRELTTPDSPGSEERICAVCAEVARQQTDPNEALALANRFMALREVLDNEPRVKQEHRYPTEWIQIAASAHCTVENGFDSSIFSWPEAEAVAA